MLGWLVAVGLTGCTGTPAPPPPPTPSPPAEVAVLEPTSVAGGMTELVADPVFLDTLEELGLVPRVAGRAGLLVSTGTFSFPVTGGEVEVRPDRELRGELRHDGSRLLLTSGTSTVTLDDLVLAAGDEVVTADVTVDGAPRAEDAPVLAVDAADLRVAPAAGPDAVPVLGGLRVVLTASGAELLNAALAPDGLDPGAPVGAVTVTLEPARP